jgi:zinc transport system permease protein
MNSLLDALKSLEFVEALCNPDLNLTRHALWAGLLASVPLGIIGTYVVTRRITYIAGAISHCVLGGIGAGLFLQFNLGLSWFHPMYGAVAVALLAAIVIGLVSLYARQREDTVIGAIWAVGMAVGLLLINKTPVYSDLMSYLFGSILLVSEQDLWTVAGLGVVVLVVGVLFHHKFLAVCFDEEFTELRGVRVKFYYLLLLCLTALTVVLLVRVVGIVLVIALLTLPAAVAGHFSRRMWQMMVLAVFFCAAFIVAGLAVSYSPNLLPEPTIIVIAGAAYLVVVVGSRVLRRGNA